MRSVAIKIQQFVLCIFLLLSSCIDPYNIPVGHANGYLVVDGFINASGQIVVRLSRTVTASPETTNQPEENARVTVEGEDQISYDLHEITEGSYKYNAPIAKDKKYRIRIVTKDGYQYTSTFVDVKLPPPIDSVTWNIDYVKRGIQFYVFTHDAASNSRYYHWEYDETWEYHAPFTTGWEYKDGQVIRNFELANTINTCYMTKGSSEIFIETTDRLSSNVVYRHPLNFIPANSEKLESGYRILIKQYTTTEEEYKYLVEMKKGTENRGSIFDAQPSTPVGNIQCINDPKELVLGFIGAHGVAQESVIIVANGSLPPWFNGTTVYSQCPGLAALAVPTTPQNIAYVNALLKSGAYLPANDPDVPGRYIFQPKICVDCRERGGTNIKPFYWPY